MKVSQISDDRLVTTAAGFAALGSEQRLSVLRILVRAGDAGLNIGELGRRTSITGSTLTHHVKVLAGAGLVTQRRDGRQILCAARLKRVQELSTYLMQECCADLDLTEGHGHE